MGPEIEDILERVERLTNADSMSAAEALEFVRELIGELEMMADALRDEADQ